MRTKILIQPTSTPICTSTRRPSTRKQSRSIGRAWTPPLCRRCTCAWARTTPGQKPPKTRHTKSRRLPRMLLAQLVGENSQTPIVIVRLHVGFHHILHKEIRVLTQQARSIGHFRGPYAGKKFAEVETIVKKRVIFLDNFIWNWKKKMPNMPNERFLLGIHSSYKCDFGRPTSRGMITGLVLKRNGVHRIVSLSRENL